MDEQPMNEEIWEKKLKEIKSIFISTCLNCGTAKMEQVYQVDSCFFKGKRCYLLKCENCGIHGLGTFGWAPGKGSGLTLSAFQSSPLIPQHIIAAFREALICYHVQAYHAAATQARRTLESVLIDRGAASRLSINEMINDLVQHGRLPPELEFLYHDIRGTGASGAHPKETLEEKDANVALNQLDIIVSCIFGEKIWRKPPGDKQS